MAKKAEVIITCDGTTAKQVLEGINRELARAIKEREQLLQKQKQNGTLTQEEIKRDKELQKYISALNTQQQRATQEMRKYGEVMKDLSGSKLKDLKKAFREGKQALENMSAKSKGREKLMSDLQKIQNQINKLQGTTTSFGKTHNSVWQTAVRNITAYVGVFAAFNKIKSMVEGVFKANLQLSDSLANIRKVSGLSGEAINQLYNNISKIDSRNTIETLNNLAYTGAKLGIGQNYGVEGLTGFVKAAEQVQMALGEDMGEDALPALAKMTEVMGLIDKYGVEQSMQKAASAIFQLGATSTATGTNIVEFSKRLYGLANVSRVSTDDLLALGSAADAMGLMPEVAATAFNKLFTSVQRQHNLIEQTLGMQKGRIKELYDEGKTMDAIVEIFDKMNQKGNLNLLGTVFKDLGSDGARLVNVMATMADRVDILKKHLETSRDAFKEGEAVIGEYMIQNQTAQALMERSSNLWAKAFTNPEGVDMVKQMAQAWYDLSKSMTQSDAQMKSLHVSINLIALGVETLIKLMPFLIRAMMMFGVLAAIRGVVTGIGGMVTAIRTATTAQIALNTAMKSNWFLAIASGIAAALTLLYDYSKAAEEAAERERKRKAELKAAFENSREAVESVVKPLKVYKKALDDANLSEKQKMDMVKQFKNDYQDYLDYLGIEIESAVDLAKAYAQVVKVMKQKKAYEERESFRQQKNGDNRMERIENQAQVEAQLQSMGITGIDKKWLEQNEHLGTKGVYDKIMRQQYGMGAWEVKGTGRGRWATRDSKGKIKEVGSEALWDIINDYIGSYRTERDTNKQIDAMFNSEYKDIDLEHFNIDEFNDRVQRARWKRKGSLDNEKPDKAAIAAAKKAAADRKQALRKEMQDAQKDVDGLIAKVDQWYNLQDATINDFAASGKITDDEAKKALEAMKIARNIALEKARTAVASGDDTEWKKFYTDQMSKMMVDHGEWSTELFKEITEVDIKALHDFLAKFNGSDVMAKLDASSFFDTMRKKAAENKKVVSETQAKAAEELNKLLLKYDYFQQASLQFAKNLTQIGALGTTAEQMANGMEGVPNAKQTQEAAQSMLAAVVRQGSSIYAVNPSDAKGVADMLRQATTEAMTEADYLAGKTGSEQAKWFDLFPEVKDWMDNPEQHKKELEQLFNVMLIAEQDYYSKRKQSYQTAKREQENRFRAAGFTDQEEQEQTALSNLAKQKDAGIGATFMEQQGLGSIANDPEVMAIQNRIYWRNEEVKAAEARLQALKAQQDQEIENAQAAGATLAELDRIRSEQAAERMGLEDLLKEKQSALFDQELNLSTKVAQELQKRVQTINSLTKPITDFTQAAGRKIGDMIFNMESEEATWEQLWKNMALAVGESVIQMGAQYAQNLIMQQAMNRASEAEAVADAGVKVTAGIAAGSAKTIGELGWWGIPLIGVISALLMGLLQSALSTKSSKDGSSSSSSTAATAKTKLVSGMLTYDKGNVDKFAGRRKLYDDGETQVYGRRRYLGEDGKVYTATAEPAPKDGLVTHPIATTVQGQPALVAENGPEIVIGRETTKAIMMNEPELIKYLANYQQHGARRLFDSGNVESVSVAQQQQTEGTTDNTPIATLAAVVADLSDTVQKLQKNGIPAHINKFGKGGLIDEVQSGLKFVNRYGG